MPRRTLTQEENQPSITTLLSNCPVCTKSECMECDLTALDPAGDVDLEVVNIEDNNNIKKGKGNTDPVVVPKKNLRKKHYIKPQRKWQHQKKIPHQPLKLSQNHQRQTQIIRILMNSLLLS